MGVPVYCLVKDRFAPAAVSRYLAGAFVWNIRFLNPSSFLDGMHAIYNKLSGPAVLIPTDDKTAILMAQCAAALKPRFLLPHLHRDLPARLANKKLLYELCKAKGIPVPKTVAPESLEEAQSFGKDVRFPVVVKAAASWLVNGRPCTTAIVRNVDHLSKLYRSAEGDRPGNILIQEYIPREFGEDWFYHGYRSARTEHCFGFTGRKLRSYPALTGPTTLGQTMANVCLRTQAEQLLKSISYAGIADLDYRYDKRDAQYKLLDFNPRLGAQFRLFEDALGTDVVRALYLDLTGHNVPDARPTTNRIFIAEFHELAAEVVYLLRGFGIGDLRVSFNGNRELAWFASDDPLPLAMMCVHLGKRVAERALGRNWEGNTIAEQPRYINGLFRHSDGRIAKPFSKAV